MSLIINHTKLNVWLKEIVPSINHLKCVSYSFCHASVILLSICIAALCEVVKAHWDRCKQPIGVWRFKKSVALYPGCVQALLPSNCLCRLETARPDHVTWPFLLFKTTLLSVRGLFRLLEAAVWIGTRPTIHPALSHKPFVQSEKKRKEIIKYIKKKIIFFAHSTGYCISLSCGPVSQMQTPSWSERYYARMRV